MSIRSLLTVIVFLILSSGLAQAAEEEQNTKAEYEIQGKKYLVMFGKELYQKIDINKKSSGWASTFFVQFAGPRVNWGLGEAGSEDARWMIVRCLPYSEGKSISYHLVFQRKLTRKWVNIFPIDWNTGAACTVRDHERLYIKLANCDREVALQEKINSLRHDLLLMYCMPERDELSPDDSISFNADRIAKAIHYNVYIGVTPNFSAVKSSMDFYEIPSEPPIPVLAVAGIIEFMDQPFPEKGKIHHPEEGTLISFFDIDQNVKVDVLSPKNQDHFRRLFRESRLFASGRHTGGD